MQLSVDPDDIANLVRLLGASLGELRRTMLDVDTPPAYLFADQRPRLVGARSRALAVLEEWAALEPQKAIDIHSRLPDIVRHHSIAGSLLQAAAWSDDGDPLITLFEFPAADSPVFAAESLLLPLLDESGLVAVAGLDARPWGLHVGKYAFHYHQLLRRSYGSGIHYGLVRTILERSVHDGLTVRLAIDERRVQFKDEYQEFHEADYWYGPTLDDGDLDDLLAVGETFHGDPNGGLSFLNPYAGLSVRWTARGDLKTVEIEEFMPPDPSSNWVFARYLHAIRDTKRKAFVHCDGAVKAYSAERYPRTQHAFRERGKGDLYRKLFRIDGVFPASVWSDLACSWFRGNTLIVEYFKGPT